jgi:hypothetical protein
LDNDQPDHNRLDYIDFFVTFFYNNSFLHKKYFLFFVNLIRCCQLETNKKPNPFSGLFLLSYFDTFFLEQQQE